MEEKEGISGKQKKGRDTEEISAALNTRGRSGQEKVRN